MKVILTRVLPATSTKSARVLARTCDGNRITVRYDDVTTNPHLYAAIMLVRKMEWAPIVLAGGGVEDDKHAFVMLKPTPLLVASVLEAVRAGNGALQIFHHVSA